MSGNCNSLFPFPLTAAVSEKDKENNQAKVWTEKKKGDFE